MIDYRAIAQVSRYRPSLRGRCTVDCHDGVPVRVYAQDVGRGHSHGRGAAAAGRLLAGSGGGRVNCNSRAGRDCD